VSEDAGLTIRDFWTIVGSASVAITLAGIVLAHLLDKWRKIGRHIDQVTGYEGWRIQTMLKRLYELEPSISDDKKRDELMRVQAEYQTALREKKRDEDLATVAASPLNLSRRHWASTAMKERVAKIGRSTKGDLEAGDSKGPVNGQTSLPEVMSPASVPQALR
jgi:hypothetical protein